MVYAVVQLLMAISALASLSGLDPAASVQVIGGWRIGLRVAWFTLGLVFAGNCVLYLIGGWLGHRGRSGHVQIPAVHGTDVAFRGDHAYRSARRAGDHIRLGGVVFASDRRDTFPIRDQSRKAQHAHLSGDIGGWPTDERNAANRRCCE